MQGLSGIAVSGGFMAILGILLAWLLTLANKRLYVYEDPRIDEVEEMLPHSNCGSCGMAGCRNFAEEVVAGRIEPARCTVNPPDRNTAIAKLLGVALGQAERRVARLACAGGSHVARMRARYDGLATCRAAATVGGGGKACAWGCLGIGDCAAVCEFGAITMNAFDLPVVDAARCTACGDCVESAPRTCSRSSRSPANCGWPAATAPRPRPPRRSARWPAPPAAAAWPMPRRV